MRKSIKKLPRKTFSLEVRFLCSRSILLWSCPSAYRIIEWIGSDSTLGIVENRMSRVDFEPMHDVERGVTNGPVENLMDFEEEGNVSVAL